MKLLTILILLSGYVNAESLIQDKARINYLLNCQGCHRSDGSGMSGFVPNMKGYLSNFLTVSSGREFLVRVPGSANAPLSDQELADTLNWMLIEFSEKQLPSDFIPYSDEEVAGFRSLGGLINVDVQRAVLVKQIEDENF